MPRRSRKKKAQYYALPVSGEDFARFRQDMNPDSLKRALRRATMGASPAETDYFVFIKSTHEALFCFAVTKKPTGRKKNRFYVLDDPGEFVGELFDRMRAVYPKEHSDALLDLGVRAEMDSLLAHSDLVEVIYPGSQAPTPDVSSFYAKEIESYVNDMTLPVHETQLRQIVAKKRSQLIRRYVSDPSLPLTGVSRKNRPVILRARQEFERTERQKQEAQRQLMARQDVAPLPRQVDQAVRFHGDDSEALADDILWRQLDLIDPVSLERVRNPVVLPSGTLVDQSSVSTIRLRGRDPMTNLPLTSTSLGVNPKIRNVIDDLAPKSSAVESDVGRTPRQKARAFFALRRSYQDKLRQARTIT